MFAKEFLLLFLEGLLTKEQQKYRIGQRDGTLCKRNLFCAIFVFKVETLFVLGLGSNLSSNGTFQHLFSGHETLRRGNPQPVVTSLNADSILSYVSLDGMRALTSCWCATSKSNGHVIAGISGYKL